MTPRKETRQVVIDDLISPMEEACPLHVICTPEEVASFAVTAANRRFFEREVIGHDIDPDHPSMAEELEWHITDGLMRGAIRDQETVDHLVNVAYSEFKSRYEYLQAIVPLYAGLA